jgi:predicted glycosyltransferase
MDFDFDTALEWEESGAFKLLELVYDLILVYSCLQIFDPIREYGLSPAVAAKTVFTGYFRRPEPARPVNGIRGELSAAECARPHREHVELRKALLPARAQVRC